VKEEDEVLIKEALAGKEKAFKLLLNKYRESIYHVIFKIVHNQEEARDLLQETFMKAFSSLATYKSNYRFTTWLYKIAANSSIDYLRRKKIESLSLDRPLETKDGTVEIELPDWTYNPETDLVCRQRMVSMNEAIDSLPKKYREVIVYRHQQEKSYEQIAEILGIPVGTVKARIFRARELLKKKLKSLR
jgi:RNA polymerase sigma factor (sigma-70 family)